MRYALIFLVMICSSFTLTGQEQTKKRVLANLEIPDEIISRIPEGDMAQFLIARQRVLDKNRNDSSMLNAFEEIGVDKAVLSRIPSGDLFSFLIERNYVEILPQEHVGSNANHGPPPPEKMINILYLFLVLLAGIILTGLFLNHLIKKKELEIIVKSLDNNREIPFDLLSSSRKRNYLSNAIIFFTIGMGLTIMGWFDILPSILAYVPFSIAVGYIAIRYLND